MSDKWNKRFMNLAFNIADWSKDPSTKVGCVIVNPDRIIVGTGYNGFARGVYDSEKRLNDRSKKYPMIIHAEVNAVLNSSSSLKDGKAYVTHSPCAHCASVLVQSGVSEIITNPIPDDLLERFKESFTLARQILTESDTVYTVLYD